MNILFTLVGIVLVAAVFWDVVSTTLLLRGGGTLSLPLAHRIWKSCVAIHARLESRSFLCLCGVFTLIGTIAFWIVGYWLGWTLIFSASSHSVLAASTELPASFAERAYYVGFTFITLGIGDFKAGTVFWQILTILLSISGFFLVTLVITYLVPVVSATVEQRQLAVYLNSFSLIRGGLLNSQGDLSKLIDTLGSLNMQICRLSQQHLAYPILQFMQSHDYKSSSPLALAELDETLTVILNGGMDLPLKREHVLPLRNSLTNYLTTIRTIHIPIVEDEAPPPPSLEPLRSMGYRSLDHHIYGKRVKRLEQRRKMLNSLIAYSGWKWQDIEKRGRGTELYFLTDELSLSSEAGDGKGSPGL